MLLFLIINVFIFIKDLLILWKLLTPAEKDNTPILLKKHVNISIQKSYEYTGFIPEVFAFPSCTAVNSDPTSVQKICTIWTLFRTLYTKMQWVFQRVPTFADLDPTFSNHFFDSFQCHLKLTKGNLNYSAAYLIWRPKLLLVLRFSLPAFFLHPLTWTQGIEYFHGLIMTLSKLWLNTISLNIFCPTCKLGTSPLKLSQQL